jgi:ATP-dependent Lon protease
VPEKNKNDVQEIDKTLKAGITFIYVRDISQVFKHAFSHGTTSRRSTK